MLGEPNGAGDACLLLLADGFRLPGYRLKGGAGVALLGALSEESRSIAPRLSRPRHAPDCAASRFDGEPALRYRARQTATIHSHRAAGALCARCRFCSLSWMKTAGSDNRYDAGVDVAEPSLTLRAYWPWLSRREARALERLTKRNIRLVSLSDLLDAGEALGLLWDAEWECLVDDDALDRPNLSPEQRWWLSAVSLGVRDELNRRRREGEPFWVLPGVSRPIQARRPRARLKARPRGRRARHARSRARSPGRGDDDPPDPAPALGRVPSPPAERRLPRDRPPSRLVCPRCGSSDLVYGCGSLQPGVAMCRRRRVVSYHPATSENGPGSAGNAPRPDTEEYPSMQRRPYATRPLR